MKETSYQNLSESERELLDAAEKAMGRAYAPYSKFYVGAALLTDDGKVITGGNVENAAYSACICAERSAIVRANAEGYKKFQALAVIAKGENIGTEQLTAPCGVCRQVLYEFQQLFGVDLKVILSTTKKDKIGILSLNELLPHAFGPRDLGVSGY